jgi:hypothetical protein
MWRSWVAVILADGFIAILLYLVGLEIWLTFKGGKPVGGYVWDFLVKHPWMDIGFGLFLGALLGHFLAKGPIPWVTPIHWPWS